MTYLALYRTWRPRKFSEVVGQDHVVRTLVNAAKKGKLTHAYLFCGPRGTGKTSIAKILACAVNCRCPVEGDPCGQCDICRDIEAGASMDVSEIDAASNRGIDEVRELREKIGFAPSSGKVRVFIIDEVHMLTNEAFNALLKTLEEPPAHALFIMATTEPHRIPLTILSRCQRFDFHRIGDREMSARLLMVAESAGITIDRPALDLIIRASEGGLRDALSILDQAFAYSGKKICQDDIHGILGTVREDWLRGAAQSLMNGQPAKALNMVGDLVDQGRDLRVFAKELNAYLRGLLLKAITNPEEKAGNTGLLTSAIEILAAAEQDMRWSTQPRVLLEVAMVKVSAMFSGGVDGSLLERVGNLSTRLKELEGLVARLAEGQAQAGVAAPEKTVEKYGKPPGAGSLSPEKTVRPAPVKPERKDVSGGNKRADVAGEYKTEVPYRPDMTVKKSGRQEAAASGALLKKIEARWNDILDVGRRLYPHISAHLAKGRGWPLALEGNTLTIAFPKDESYTSLALGILQKEKNTQELQELIKSVCREELQIKLVESGQKPPAPSGPPLATARLARSDDADALFGIEEEESPFE